MPTIVVHLPNGETDTHSAEYPTPLDVVDRDGVLSIIWSRYQGSETRRVEYPLTSIRNWEYSR